MNEITRDTTKGRHRTQAEKDQDAQLLAEGKKWCRLCNTIKDISDFHKRTSSADGYMPYCIRCNHKTYHEPHKEAKNAYVKKWMKENPERAKAIRKRAKSGPKSRILRSIKKRINKYLKTTDTKHLHREIINCTPIDLIVYLESKFSSEMSWANYGTLWHIDHIIPCVAFNWTVKEHILWCWDYRNLRPLLSSENEKKGDTLSNGRSAREFKETDLTAFHQFMSLELSKAGISSVQDYLVSVGLLSP